MGKAYCMAFGCLNNNNKDPNLTFFTLPTDIERRRKWLTLINREELIKREDLKRTSHLVCSAHFEDSSIKIIKKLKDDALPTMLLHNQPQESTSCSEVQSTSTTARMKGKVIPLSNNKEHVTVGTQTESIQSSQTSKSLTEGTPKKQKLSNEIQECKLKRRKLDQEITKIKKKKEKTNSL